MTSSWPYPTSMLTGMEGLAYPQFQAPYGEYSQGPFDVLDYEVDWATSLPTGDVIETATWSADEGLTITDGGFTDTKTTVWVSGGMGGYLYHVTVMITTSGHRTMGKVLKFKIKSAA